MADPSALDFLRIPAGVLISLDNRAYHFALQPWHYLVRIAHVVSMGGFYGGIALLDLRLLGVRASTPVRGLAEHTLPWLYVSFAIAIATGTMLFLYDPVHVGSHAFFAPKLLLIVFALLNAQIFHRTAYAQTLAGEHAAPLAGRFAGGLSLALWTGVVICASLNVESAPKVLLR